MAEAIYSRWLAFALNFFIPPAGYVYIGRLRLAILMMAGLLALLAALFTLSIVYPPGLFDFVGSKGVNPVYPLVVGGAFGAHAAYLAPMAKPRELSGLAYWIVLLGLPLSVLCIAFLVRAFAPVSIYSVSSASGMPTLAEGDVVAVAGGRALCGYTKPMAGDLIVYRHGSGSYLKRVIAGPDEIVTIRSTKLWLNGKLLKTQDAGLAPADPLGTRGRIVIETLPSGASYRTLVTGQEPAFDNFGPYKVPPDAWFVLGDNRDNSLDSRNDGAVRQSQICGVVMKLVKSPSGNVGEPLESREHP